MGPHCFIAGTLVACLSADGEEIHKPIEEIEVGDRVLAYDEETGEQAYKPVVRLFRNQTKEWCHVFVDGEEIKSTGEHPFYVKGKGFIPAKELRRGDKCLLSTGEDVTIEKVEVEKLTEAETTYNFEVADFHTYYVTDKDVLVHNMCAQMRDGPKSPKLMNDTYLKKNGIDPHAFKNEFVAESARARYDIYLDTADDMLWIGSKHHPTVWIETYTKFTRR